MSANGHRTCTHSREDAARVLARAADLDALLKEEMTTDELRLAALEAGISMAAFEAALAEPQVGRPKLDRWKMTWGRWAMIGIGAAMAGVPAYLTLFGSLDGFDASVRAIPVLTAVTILSALTSDDEEHFEIQTRNLMLWAAFAAVWSIAGLRDYIEIVNNSIGFGGVAAAAAFGIVFAKKKILTWISPRVNVSEVGQ